jgi:hypothetical protein
MSVVKGKLEVTTSYVYFFDGSPYREDVERHDFRWSLAQVCSKYLLLFIHFQENFPSTLLFGTSCFTIFKKILIRNSCCIRNSRVRSLSKKYPLKEKLATRNGNLPSRGIYKSSLEHMFFLNKFFFFPDTGTAFEKVQFTSHSFGIFFSRPNQHVHQFSVKSQEKQGTVYILGQ